MKRRILEAWGYVVEILLSGALTALAIVAFGKEKFFKEISKIAPDFAAIFCGVMFAGSIALLALFLTNTSGPFSKWLKSTGSYLVFIRSTIYPCAVFAVTILFSILVKSSNLEELIFPLSFLLLLSIINSYTLLMNTYDLVKLRIAFGSAMENNSSD